MWNLIGEYFCLLKEKDFQEFYQMENINSGFFVLVLLIYFDKQFYSVQCYDVIKKSLLLVRLFIY